MTARVNACPTEASFERYFAGECAPDEASRVVTHARACAACHERLDASRRDELLVGELRRAMSGWPSVAPAVVAAEEPAIARYRVLCCIGQGGMGRVYEAEQKHPQRSVALKVLQPGLSDRRWLRRFEFEAEVLARLDHPGIARVYEAGTYAGPGGEQPFFAMELVRGRALREHLREAKPSLRELLELFAAICDAVHHAHQKGVVHRDLKPANILVGSDGRPKVLDFGVAAAIDVDRQRETLATDAGSIVGTLPYMAPEVLESGAARADTRCDVYALGVLLYEMLSGAPPFELRGRGLAEAARIVAETPPKSLGALRRELRGDLETIAAKALEKAPEQRYASASDLADDVRRHLRHEPITARRTGAGEQLRRWAQRYPGVAASLAALIAVVAIGTLATAWLALRARRAEVLAAGERDAALRAAARAEAALDFVKRAIQAANPREGGRGVDFTVREMLDETAREIEGGIAGEPELEASLRITIGDAYRVLGLVDAARTQDERAVELRRAALGPEHASVAEALNALAAVEAGAGRNEDAERHLREALAIYRVCVDPLDLRIAASSTNLAALLVRRGELDLADAAYAEALAIRRAASGDDHPEVANLLLHVAGLRIHQDRGDEGEALARDAHAMLLWTRGELHLDTAIAAQRLAEFLHVHGRGAEAEPFWRGALAAYRALLGDAHASVAVPAARVAELVQNEQPDDALALYRLALGALTVASDADRATRLALQINLAALLLGRGEFVEAEQILRSVLEEKLALLGTERHATIAVAKNNLARVLAELERLDEAERLQSEALDTSLALDGESAPSVTRARAKLAEIRAKRRIRARLKSSGGFEAGSNPPRAPPRNRRRAPRRARRPCESASQEC